MIAARVSKCILNADLRHENAQMTASLPLVNTAENTIGWMKHEIWNGMQRILHGQAGLATALDGPQV